MKIAKKVLALVMAVAMIACLSAMAFAATPKYAAKVTVSNEDKTVSVALSAKDYVGLESGSIVLTYDAKVLAFSYNDEGKDSSQIAGCKKNSYTSEINGDVAGTVNYSFYFKENLWTSEQFAADAKKAGTVDVDSANFELTVIVFDIIDEKAAATDISFTATGKDATAENKFSDKVTATIKAAEPSKVEPISSVVDETKAEDPSKNPSTGDEDKKTGDNYALAAAAGVVVLAGAAFIITKKRK